MSKFCTGSSQATITIFSPLLKVQVAAPADISTSSMSVETYVHNTNEPINKTYERVVRTVTFSTPGQTYNNGALSNPIRNCPMPDINGKQITSDFDNYYLDNTGNCSYQVTLGGGISINGKIYPSDDNRFTVSCDDDCSNGYCKIDCETYPGYCCIDETEIHNLTNQLNS